MCCRPAAVWICLLNFPAWLTVYSYGGYKKRSCAGCRIKIETPSTSGSDDQRGTNPMMYDKKGSVKKQKAFPSWAGCVLRGCRKNGTTPPPRTQVMRATSESLLAGYMVVASDKHVVYDFLFMCMCFPISLHIPICMCIYSSPFSPFPFLINWLGGK
jgi:hypothetical protein